MNLKCDPAEAEMLRDIFPAVIPGYHMNKRHWNTVELDGSIPDSEIQRMVDNSFALVVGGLRLARATVSGNSAWKSSALRQAPGLTAAQCPWTGLALERHKQALSFLSFTATTRA